MQLKLSVLKKIGSLSNKGFVVDKVYAWMHLVFIMSLVKVMDSSAKYSFVNKSENKKEQVVFN